MIFSFSENFKTSINTYNLTIVHDFLFNNMNIYLPSDAKKKNSCCVKQAAVPVMCKFAIGKEKRKTNKVYNATLSKFKCRLL